MSDRRLHPGNGRVVLEGFEPSGNETLVAGRAATMGRDAFLLASPEGARDRELLFGDPVTVIDTLPVGAAPMCFVRSHKDGYVGWIEGAAIGAVVAPSHWVAARTTYAYPAPDLKSVPVFPLHMTSPVRVVARAEDWAQIAHAEEAWVPVSHIREIGDWMDPVEAARAYRGTHYIWAGNSGFGLDCSGLVSQVFRAAGLTCPGDSDLQEKMEGQVLGEGDALRACDLIFWKGHVAMATGPDMMIHANATHMMVVEEEIAAAIERIAATDTGAVTLRLRPARRSLSSLVS